MKRVKRAVFRLSLSTGFLLLALSCAVLWRAGGERPILTLPLSEAQALSPLLALEAGSEPRWQQQRRWEWERRAGLFAFEGGKDQEALAAAAAGRLRLARAATSARTPQDWQRYQRDWLSHAVGLPYWQARLWLVQDLRRAWVWASAMGLSEGELWARIRARPFALERSGGVFTARAPLPAAVGSSPSLAQLQAWEVTRAQIGAQFLSAPASWSLASGQLSKDLVEANQRLSRVVRWNGPVLGLGGRIGYHMGDVTLDSHPGEPGLRIMGLTTHLPGWGMSPTVALSDRAWLDPLVHEWWHAAASIFSASPQLAPLWQDLRIQLLKPQLPREVQQVAWRQARAASLQHCARAFGYSFSQLPTPARRSSSLLSWEKFGLSDDPSTSTLQAWVWKESAFLQQSPSPQGPWRGFASSLRLATGPVWIEQRLKPFVDYFAADEDEAMARAFERQAQFIVRAPGRFGYRPMQPGACSGQGSVLMYPTSAEQAYFNPQWQRFFQQLRPWWQTARTLPSD